MTDQPIEALIYLQSTNSLNRVRAINTSTNMLINQPDRRINTSSDPNHNRSILESYSLKISTNQQLKFLTNHGNSKFKIVQASRQSQPFKFRTNHNKNRSRPLFARWTGFNKKVCPQAHEEPATSCHEPCRDGFRRTNHVRSWAIMGLNEPTTSATAPRWASRNQPCQQPFHLPRAADTKFTRSRSKRQPHQQSGHPDSCRRPYTMKAAVTPFGQFKI